MTAKTKQYLVGFGILILLILLAAVSFILYTTVRLQQNLGKNAGPSYDASQLYSRAVAQVGQGDYAQAEGYLEQALQKQPDDSYRSQLAVVKYRLKKYGESVQQYQRLVDDKQDLGFAYNGMGNAYRDWADAEAANKTAYQAKAESAYGQAMLADPGYVAAYSNEALMLDAEGRHDEALAILKKGQAQTGSTELGDILKRLAR